MKNVCNWHSFPEKLVPLINCGYENFTTTITIKDLEDNILLRIHLEEFSSNINFDVTFPLIVINQKFVIKHEKNFGDLIIDLALQLASIEEERERLKEQEA